MSTAMRWLTVFAACGVLAACGEASGPGQSVRKSDTPAHRGADNPYVAEGWKSGDQASWEQHMRTRAQGQNEYTRTSGG